MKERKREERKTSTKMVSHTRGRENRGEREKSSSGRKSRTKTSKKADEHGGRTNRTGGDATADNGRGATAEIRNEVGMMNTPISKRKVETAGGERCRTMRMF